jgi:hypothetical protein
MDLAGAFDMFSRSISSTAVSQRPISSMDDQVGERLAAPAHTASPTSEQEHRQAVSDRNPRVLASKGVFNFLAILNRQSRSQPRPEIKGFSSADLQKLEYLSRQEQLFVQHFHTKLKQLRYKPLDMLHLAVQSPYNRDFVLNSGQQLIDFTPTEINSCALLRSDQRDFIVRHYEDIRRIGSSVREMFQLANVPQAHLAFIARHWHSLIGTKLQFAQMHQFARMPETTRNLLIANFGVFQARHFSPDEWAEITAFNEHQCYRLIREYRPFASRPVQELLDDIGHDSGTQKWPENLDWLDETSHTSIQRWLAYAHARENLLIPKISTFCSEVMPSAFLARLHDDPAAQPLGALIAGAVFTTTYAKRPELAKRSTRVLLEYIEEKNNAKLWAECQKEAKDAIERCGDRVEYGLSRILQVIEKHKIAIGDLKPEAALLSVLRQFNLERVEAAAQTIAIEKGVESESIEVYLSLASQLAQQGLDLGEMPVEGRYINLPQYAVPAYRVVQVKKMLDAHRSDNSPELLAAFEENLGAQFALRNLFPADYEVMIKDRELVEDEETDIILAPKSTDGERQAARLKLDALGGAEQNWYRTKLKLALAELANS